MKGYKKTQLHDKVTILSRFRAACGVFPPNICGIIVECTIESIINQVIKYCISNESNFINDFDYSGLIIL